MRFRLTLLFLLIAAPFLAISAKLVLAQAISSRTSLLKKTYESTFVQAKSALLQPDWKWRLDEIFDDHLVRHNHIGGLVMDPSGAVIWRSTYDSPNSPSPDGEQLPRLTIGDNTLLLTHPDTRQADLDSHRHLLALTVVSVIVVALGSWVLVSKTLSPIRALAKQAATASAEDLSQRLVSPSQDVEMRELVDTLNNFLDRIEVVSEEKGQFYAAASHELRTPLQALSGHLELAVDRPRDEEYYRAAIQEALAQTQRLTSLVEAILLLHRLQGSTEQTREPFDASRETIEVLTSLQPLIEARELTVTTSIQDHVIISELPTHLSIVLRNLLENAAKYAKHGGNIHVALSPQKLTIENDLDPETVLNTDRLLDPFTRQESSRSSKSGGNGLGLAICSAISKSNSWPLSASQSGMRFCVELGFVG